MILSGSYLDVRLLSSYQLGVESKRNNCKQTEDVAHQDEVVTAGVGVHDDPPVVELVVHKHEDDCEDDANNTDGQHGNVQSHGDRPDVWLDDGPVLWRVPPPPPDHFLPWMSSIINRGRAEDQRLT